MSAATVTYANDGLVKGTYGYLDQTGKASPCLRWSKELNPRQAQIRVAALAKKLESHACLHVLWRTHPLCDTMLTLAFVKTAQPQDGDSPPWTEAIGEPKASYRHVKGNPAFPEGVQGDYAFLGPNGGRSRHLHWSESLTPTKAYQRVALVSAERTSPDLHVLWRYSPLRPGRVDLAFLAVTQAQESTLPPWMPRVKRPKRDFFDILTEDDIL